MFLKIYLKEMKDSLRDRRTLLMGVFIPILVLTGLTLFYENIMADSKQTFTLAVSSSIAKDEEQLVSGLKNVNTKSFTDPEKAVRDGDAQAAVTFDSGFVQKINSGQQANATLYGDSFSKNSSVLMEMIDAQLTAFEEGVVKNRLQAANLDPMVIQPLEVTTKEMNSEDDSAAALSIFSNFLPMIISMAIVSGAYPSATDLFAGEKDRKTMEALLITPVSRTKMLLAKWLTVSTIAVFSGVAAVAVVSLEIIFLTEKLKEALQFGDHVWIFIGITLITSVMFALFMSSVQMLASLISKSVKEAQSYQTPIMMLPILPIFTLTSTGVNETSFQHFIIPAINMFALIKEMLYGIINVQNILLTVGSTALFMIIVLAVTVSLFKKDQWVMGK
ncbi:ABC transporter permease [Metabacillus sp. KIGAM252]|uniref:ABC transporter permease n=1 Tax=Metabacillus flavus TaxID=2823519 RepID=A0ABS5LB20_9BACI|nr:ABC transporter permease [Metabacillus flavus]MBS2967931.1 ABC transporter permease [Metabacillus flavus]